MLTWPHVLDRLKAGEACVMVTVFEAAGSAPRDAGARMVVGPDGGFNGTIGGGALEWEALLHARALLAEPKAGFEFRRFALGPDLGQCCGGAVMVGFETFDIGARQRVEAFAEREGAGASFATKGYFHQDGHVERAIAEADTEASQRVGARFSPEGEILECFGEIRRDLLLFGAGHVGRSLVLALAPLPFRIKWIDSRRDAFPSHMPANVTAHHVEEPAEALERAEKGAFVVVMTHDHRLDEEITAAALAASRFDYVGLIGSATKKARFLKRFRQQGLSGEAIDALVCPIGIDGIGSKAPAAIAASVAAQLLLVHEAVDAEDKGLPEKEAAALTV